MTAIILPRGTNPTPTAATGLSPEQHTLAIKVDEFAELHLKYATIIERIADLKKELNQAATALPDHGPVVLEGFRYAIDYTDHAKTQECTMTPAAFVAETNAWDALKISVTEAKKLLSPSQMAQYFHSVPGSRRLKRVRPLI